MVTKCLSTKFGINLFDNFRENGFYRRTDGPTSATLSNLAFVLFVLFLRDVVQLSKVFQRMTPCVAFCPSHVQSLVHDLWYFFP